MTGPIFTLTDSANSPLQVLSFGVVDAGNSTAGIPVRIWNNFAQAANVADAINTSITTKTYQGFDSGDSIQNGNEIVVNKMIQVECTSYGSAAYSAIGGPEDAIISDSPPAGGNTPPPPTIHSAQYAACLLRANVPASASDGNINFLIRVIYQYQ